MSAPRLSAKAKRDIVLAYGRGEPVADIATRYGIHFTYPGILAKRRDIAPPEKARVTSRPTKSLRTKLTPYLTAKALNLYQSGKDIPDIAAALRCSFSLAARGLAEAVEAERYGAAR